ncbi:cobalt transport protein cbiQ [Clostridium tetani 12124569]|nr:cobalt transport protein cbiQ [Clostridium tetani 12124569]
MIKDITLGQYIPGDSFIHKLDPRIKIIISLIYIINLFVINNFKGYALIIAFTAMAILISKVPFKFIYRGLKPIFIMIIITALLNIFMTSGGEIIFQWKFITIYEKGLQLAIFMVIRLVLLIVGTSLLTLTTSPIELTDGIEKLLNPLKKWEYLLTN